MYCCAKALDRMGAVESRVRLGFCVAFEDVRMDVFNVGVGVGVGSWDCEDCLLLFTLYIFYIVFYT